MKRLLLLVTTTVALAFAATATAALVPGVYDPGNTGCPVAAYTNGVLHLAKNCATSTNAAAQATITGLNGQAFTSASFTLASASQCQGGSPRFDIVTTAGTFFLGCNNVTPVVNADGSATYTFTAATLAASGNQVPFPTGTITGADVLVDVQGSADLTKIAVNGVSQVPVTGDHEGGGKHHKHACPHGRTGTHDCGLHKGSQEHDQNHEQNEQH